MRSQKRLTLVIFSFLVANLFCLTLYLPVQAASPSNFVQVSGNNLALNGSPILLKGFNYYPHRNPWAYMWLQWNGSQIQTELAEASLLGANVIRVLVPYGSGSGFGWVNENTGEVTPSYLDQLRQFVQLAGNYHMKVIVTLFDFYDTFPAAGSHDELSNLTYLHTIVNAFANDDRIMSWDVHNEPDNYNTWVKNNDPNSVIDWCYRMSQEIHRSDPNHLITIGAGRYDSLWKKDNNGHSFIDMSDYISLHSYNALDFGNEIYHIREHTNKPILLEETGWPTGPVNADPNYTESYQRWVYEKAVEAVKVHNLVGMVGWTLFDFLPIGLIDMSDFQNYFGLVRRNGTLKPAAVVFRQGYSVPQLPSTTTSAIPLTAQPYDEAPRTIYFPQTDHYVSTPLKELWRRAGGEAVFGLPITDAIVITKGDNGTALGHNAHIVQYFERARFDYYPDKIHEPDFKKYNNIYKYFYIIDFGQLGREFGRTAVQNSPVVERQRADGADYQYFADTQHDLTGSFLSFWRNNYGYKLFGSPITQPITDNGLMVQYFESVRLEYHPELQVQSGEIQVSKLGVESAKAKGWLNPPSLELHQNDFSDLAFQNTWRRVDQPILDGTVARSWLWGPGGFATAIEQYQQSPDGQRLVQYFDKSRMEITNPGSDAAVKWYITNGLLAKELVSGKLQIGDATFEQRKSANIAIAGDPLEANPNAPTYSSFQNVATLSPGQNTTSDQSGKQILATINRNGQVSNLDIAPASVFYANYSNNTGHNIPDVFWDYFNHSQGPVLEGNLVQGDTVDWTFSVGLPITEAYWVKSRVGGVERDVLVQVFERRVLTYTPTNPREFEVEMGNVGRHYYVWRYQTGLN
jgi:hypothetical protein